MNDPYETKDCFVPPDGDMLHYLSYAILITDRIIMTIVAGESFVDENH